MFWFAHTRVHSFVSISPSPPFPIPSCGTSAYERQKSAVLRCSLLALTLNSAASMMLGDIETRRLLRCSLWLRDADTQHIVVRLRRGVVQLLLDVQRFWRRRHSADLLHHSRVTWPGDAAARRCHGDRKGWVWGEDESTQETRSQEETNDAGENRQTKTTTTQGQH